MSLESVEVVVRGYRAFIDGDFDAIAELLDPEVEWFPLDPGPLSFVDHEDALAVVADVRASKEERDETDTRPLQSRRKFSVERYSAVVTIRDGRVIRVQDFPHLEAAFEAAGIESES